MNRHDTNPGLSALRRDTFHSVADLAFDCHVPAPSEIVTLGFDHEGRELRTLRLVLPAGTGPEVVELWAAALRVGGCRPLPPVTSGEIDGRDWHRTIVSDWQEPVWLKARGGWHQVEVVTHGIRHLVAAAVLTPDDVPAVTK